MHRPCLCTPRPSVDQCFETISENLLKKLRASVQKCLEIVNDKSMPSDRTKKYELDCAVNHARHFLDLYKSVTREIDEQPDLSGEITRLRLALKS
jgi:hypothetical protein